jgi:hypothetical protein
LILFKVILGDVEVVDEKILGKEFTFFISFEDKSMITLMSLASRTSYLSAHQIAQLSIVYR